MAYRDDLYVRGELKVGGLLETAGAVVLGTEAITGAGALSTTVPVSFLDTTGGAAAVTLAASTVAGAIKHVIMVKDGGNATLTVASTAGAGTTYTFANVGESVMFINAADEDGAIIGWAEMSRGSGAVNAATAMDGPEVSAP